MNTETYAIMVAAEYRYLTEAERQKIRDYALGMDARLALAGRIEAVEEAVVEAVTGRVCAVRPPASAEAAKRRAGDCRCVLRYLAQAHARDDLDFFREQFVDWMIPLFEVYVGAEELGAFFAEVRRALAEQLAAADLAALARYLEAIDAGLDVERR